MTKSTIILAGMILAAALVASLLTPHSSKGKLRENDTLLRQQHDQLAELSAENQRLSNLILKIKTNSSQAEDRTAELAKLRTKAESLRHQTNQLAKKLADGRRFRLLRYLPRRAGTAEPPCWRFGLVSVRPLPE